MLNDFSAVDVEKAVRYIMSSLSYEGGFGQGPYLECHGGSTFCAVASLWLFKRMDAMTDLQIKRLRQWCHRRQESGFQGRPNKPVDTCYSFWIGGTLQILDSYEYTDKQFNRGYILSTQDNLTGGFGKWTTTTPDPLHSYMGIAALSLLGESDIKPLFVPLNISQEAVSHLYRLQASWWIISITPLIDHSSEIGVTRCLNAIRINTVCIEYVFLSTIWTTDYVRLEIFTP